MRPRFRVELERGKDEVLGGIRDELSCTRRPVRGVFSRSHVVLVCTARAQHTWSPELTLEVRETEEGTVVRGLFAPRPGVWTGFMFLYALLSMVALCGCMYGLAQWTLQRPPWALLAIPAAALLALLVRLAAHLGQRLGALEMGELRAFANESLGIRLDPREAVAARSDAGPLPAPGAPGPDGPKSP